MASLEELEARGKFKEILRVTSEDLSTPELKYWHLTALHRLGDLKQLSPLLEEYVIAVEEMDDYWKSRFYNRFATIYRIYDGKEIFIQVNQKSEKYFDLALKYAIEIEDEQHQAQILVNMAVHSMETTIDQEAALEYIDRSLFLLENNQNEKIYSYALINKARLLKNLGEYEETKILIEQSLEIRKRLGNKYDLGYTYLALGQVHSKLGDSTLALKYVRTSVEILSSVGNILTLSGPLLNLILLLIESGDIEEAEQNFNQVKGMISNLPKTGNLYFPPIIKFVEALILKSSQSLRDQMKALDILEDLLDVKHVIIDSYFITRKHYVELLLIEYRSSHNSEILTDIVRFTKEMSEHAERGKNPASQIDIMMLRSRISVVQNDFDESDRLLNEALGMATKKNMISYQKIVNREIKKLEEEISDLRESFQSSNVAEKIERMQILEYLENVKESFGS